jgi:HD superfamily phosphodiesterase
MKIPDEYKGKFFHHFTHLENIESIITNGLLSTNEKEEKGIKHVDLANENIQQRRHEMEVPCEPKGTIHDYVPFYFTGRNPMLLGVLNRKNIDQPLVVYIAVSIEKLIEDNVIFTDASANTAVLPNFYTNPNDLKQLSWELINSKKWSEKNKDDLHKRMAEVLVKGKMPIDWVDKYYVFNDMAKEEIEKLYKKHGLEKPKISYNEYFYYTKFYFTERSRETLVTGPYFMEHYFNNSQKKVKKKREKSEIQKFNFRTISDAITKIEANFCIIPELKDIYQLQTDNTVHSQSVSDHTLQVVQNLDKFDYYNGLSDSDKNLVKLSAYLHDIGKGPKSKWKNEIQQAYPDHPADSVPMIKRILIEEFEELSEYEIRIICLLVFYHDLIGDILKEPGRSEKELIKLDICKNELNMLIAIALADVSAIKSDWLINLQIKLPNFVKRIKKQIG